MGKFYDDQGNEVEAMSQEEAEELAKKQVEEKVGETKREYEEKLKGFEDKEYNFKALRDKVEKGEKLTEKEQELLKKEEELKEKEKSFQERVVDGWKERAVNARVGDDEEMRKKVLYFYNEELKGEALTEDDIQRKVDKAFYLAEAEKKRPNPINQAMGLEGREPEMKKEDNFAETEKGKAILGRIAPEIKEEDKSKKE